MKYVFDLLVDMRVVRNEDLGAVLVILLGLRGCAFHGLLCSMHDKLYVIAGITIVEKNLADVLKFILQMLWGTNVVGILKNCEIHHDYQRSLRVSFVMSTE